MLKKASRLTKWKEPEGINYCHLFLQAASISLTNAVVLLDLFIHVSIQLKQEYTGCSNMPKNKGTKDSTQKTHQ